MTRSELHRRQVLISSGSLASIVLAGCLDDDDSTEPTDDDAAQSDDDGDTGTADGTDDTTPGDDTGDDDTGADDTTPEDDTDTGDDTDAGDDDTDAGDDDTDAGDDDTEIEPLPGDGLWVADIDGPLPEQPAEEDFVDWVDEDEVVIETVQRSGERPEFVFNPPFVRVRAGTTIRWVNRDGVFHTVTSTDGGLESRSASGDFNAQIGSEGDTFEWLAEHPGRQSYYCAPHVGFMYGQLWIV